VEAAQLLKDVVSYAEKNISNLASLREVFGVVDLL